MHHVAKAAVDALFAALVDEDARNLLLTSTQLLLYQQNPFDAFFDGPASADQDGVLTLQLTFSACLITLCTEVRAHFPSWPFPLM